MPFSEESLCPERIRRSARPEQESVLCDRVFIVNSLLLFSRANLEQTAVGSARRDQYGVAAQGLMSTCRGSSGVFCVVARKRSVGRLGRYVLLFSRKAGAAIVADRGHDEAITMRGSSLAAMPKKIIPHAACTGMLFVVSGVKSC